MVTPFATMFRGSAQPRLANTGEHSSDVVLGVAGTTVNATLSWQEAAFNCLHRSSAVRDRPVMPHAALPSEAVDANPPGPATGDGRWWWFRITTSLPGRPRSHSAIATRGASLALLYNIPVGTGSAGPETAAPHGPCQRGQLQGGSGAR